MQTYREDAQTESAAHRVRTEELARRLGLTWSLPAGRIFESCREFDQAAEFAALEGLSIGDGLRQFIAQGGRPFNAQFLGLLADRPSAGGRVPVMPRAVSRLLRTSGEVVSVQELEEIAGSDPVLAGRLISTANSARFGSAHQITRLRDAILRIGIPEARKAMLAACVSGLFASATLNHIWRHSQVVAGAAAELAGRLGLDVETAWPAGLLHDIGRVALAGYAVDARVAEQNWLAAGFPATYAETLAYGRDHAEAGAAILREWNIPAPVAEAVALHHRPECSDSRLTALLCLAEDLVAARTGGPQEDLWPSLRKTVACQRAGISVNDFEALKGGCGERSACA